MIPEEFEASITTLRANVRMSSPRGPRGAGFVKGALRGGWIGTWLLALQVVVCGQVSAGQRADVDELKAALDAGATMLLIDVREDWEVASGSMPGSIHIPVAELERRMPDIPKDVRLVFF